MEDGANGETRKLTTEQAYEAAYRFVLQYYERERVVPFMLMLHSMGWHEYDDHHVTNDPASWPEWVECVRQTLGGEPLPEMSPVKGVHGWVDGTVVAWHADERWGVLSSSEVEGEVWANYMNVVGKGYTPLRESQPVRFTYRTPGTHGYPHVAEAVQLR